MLKPGSGAASEPLRNQYLDGNDRSCEDYAVSIGGHPFFCVILAIPVDDEAALDGARATLAALCGQRYGDWCLLVIPENDGTDVEALRDNLAEDHPEMAGRLDVFLSTDARPLARIARRRAGALPALILLLDPGDEPERDALLQFAAASGMHPEAHLIASGKPDGPTGPCCVTVEFVDRLDIRLCDVAACGARRLGNGWRRRTSEVRAVPCELFRPATRSSVTAGLKRTDAGEDSYPADVATLQAELAAARQVAGALLTALKEESKVPPSLEAVNGRRRNIFRFLGRRRAGLPDRTLTKSRPEPAAQRETGETDVSVVALPSPKVDGPTREADETLAQSPPEPAAQRDLGEADVSAVAMQSPRVEESRQETDETLAQAFREICGEKTWRAPLAEVSEAVDLARSIVEKVLARVPEGERAAQVKRIIGKLAFLKGVVFDGVSGRSRSSPEFDRAAWAFEAPTLNSNAVHLELGVHIAWPDERVEEFLASSGIADFIRLDMDPAVPSDVIASATALPFADGSIDRISSNALFEHVAYPHDIIREAFRVLRPGGVFITSAPFHFVQHGCPNDYLRYTPAFFDEVCRDTGFADVTTESYTCSGVYYTLHQLLKGSTAGSGKEHPCDAASQFAHILVLALLGALQAFDDHFLGEGAHHFHSTRAFAVKAGTYTPPPDRPDRTRPFVERYDNLICPATRLPLRRDGETLISADGEHRYPILTGRPHLLATSGRGPGT